MPDARTGDELQALRAVFDALEALLETRPRGEIAQRVLSALGMVAPVAAVAPAPAALTGSAVTPTLWLSEEEALKLRFQLLALPASPEQQTKWVDSMAVALRRVDALTRTSSEGAAQ